MDQAVVPPLFQLRGRNKYNHLHQLKKKVIVPFPFICFICSQLNDKCLHQVAQVTKTRVVQHLSTHPFSALTVMLFGAMAALPVGLFISFALVTALMLAIGFVFFEGKCARVKISLGIVIYTYTFTVLQPTVDFQIH
uniref:Uncharacterized protein n=1 Tax=Scophthalmus maximus TaxID=52904 RepID=A0A8D3EEA6_SCOMX